MGFRNFRPTRNPGPGRRPDHRNTYGNKISGTSEARVIKKK
jgi:hypothetical protein